MTTETPCPTCSGPIRETKGMVCQTCGTDYGPQPRFCDSRGAGGFRTTWSADHDAWFCDGCFARETGYHPCCFVLVAGTHRDHCQTEDQP